jgi:hypothetical protein
VEPNNTNETEGEPKDIGEEGANEGISWEALPLKEQQVEKKWRQKTKQHSWHQMSWMTYCYVRLYKQWKGSDASSSYLSFRVIKDKQLPMPANVFFANVVKSRPKDTTINIKQSSFKKVKTTSTRPWFDKVLAFLQFLQKRELLELKEPNKGVWVVTLINRSYPEYGFSVFSVSRY